MKQITLTLGDLACPSCLTKIQRALAHQAGVTAVKVLFNAGKAKVTFDPATTDADQIAQAVTALGYQVKQIKEVA